MCSIGDLLFKVHCALFSVTTKQLFSSLCDVPKFCKKVTNSLRNRNFYFLCSGLHISNNKYSQQEGGGVGLIIHLLSSEGEVRTFPFLQNNQQVVSFPVYQFSSNLAFDLISSKYSCYQIKRLHQFLGMFSFSPKLAVSSC